MKMKQLTMQDIHAEVQAKLQAMEESLRQQAEQYVRSLQKGEFDERVNLAYESMRPGAESDLWQQTYYEHLLKLGLIPTDPERENQSFIQ